MNQMPSRDAAESEWIAWANGLPTSAAIGLRCASLTPHRAVVWLDGSRWPLNPNGAVHGGLLAACADHGFGLLSARVAGRGTYPTTATLTVNFLRPAIPPVRFEVVVERAGRKLLFLRVSATDAQDVLVATASACMSVARPRTATDGATSDSPATGEVLSHSRFPTGIGPGCAGPILR